MTAETSTPSPAAPSIADVVIIGGSVVGSSAAWHLLDGGFGGRVVVIERDPTYERASAHRAMGGIRQQFCTPVTVQMVQYSVELWKTFDRRFAIGGRTPRAWFRQRGYLFWRMPPPLRRSPSVTSWSGAPARGCRCWRATRFARSCPTWCSTTSSLECSALRTATPHRGGVTRPSSRGRQRGRDLRAGRGRGDRR